MQAIIDIQAQRGQATGKLEFIPARNVNTPQHLLVQKHFSRLLEDLSELIENEKVGFSPKAEVVEVAQPKTPDVEEKAEPEIPAVPSLSVFSGTSDNSPSDKMSFPVEIVKPVTKASATSKKAETKPETKVETRVETKPEVKASAFPDVEDAKVADTASALPIDLSGK